MGQDEYPAALASGDTATVADALRCILDDIRCGRTPRMPAPGRDVLAAFDGETPEAAMLDLIAVLRLHRHFEPQLAEPDRIATLIALALCCATPYVAFEIALALKIGADPAFALATAIDEIMRQGVATPQRHQRARDLLTRLFDTDYARRAPMVDRLRAWPRTPPFDTLIHSLWPQLSAEEQRVLS